MFGSFQGTSKLRKPLDVALLGPHFGLGGCMAGGSTGLYERWSVRAGGLLAGARSSPWPAAMGFRGLPPKEPVKPKQIPWS